MSSAARRRPCRWVTAGLAAIGLLAVGGGIAWGADRIGTSPATNEYDKRTYNMAAGENPVLTNNTIGTSHDVTAFQRGPDGKQLFSSATIFTNQHATVQGTQYLARGDYRFFCTVHGSGMSATLHVGPGAAVPRPRLSLSILSSAIAKVRSSGKLQVKLADAGSNADGVVVKATLGRVTIARESGIAVAAGSVRKVAMALTARGRQALKGRDKASVTARGTVDFGKPDTAHRALH
jgi:plastocyanin